MRKCIISDTSCLILFDRIDSLHLLYETYGEITLTPEVFQEYGRSLPDWINIVSVKNKDRQTEFEKLVDLGEASAIALALELPDSVLIIDDKKGRILAHKLNIELTGTLGTLLKAKQKGLIPNIKPFLDKLRQIEYRLSKELEEAILRKAGE
jgi:predicted nucleic acid-binding protein